MPPRPKASDNTSLCTRASSSHPSETISSFSSRKASVSSAMASAARTSGSGREAASTLVSSLIQEMSRLSPFCSEIQALVKQRHLEFSSVRGVEPFVKLQSPAVRGAVPPEFSPYTTSKGARCSSPKGVRLPKLGILVRRS